MHVGHPPRAFRPIAIAASLFGLVALEAIVITIKTRSGETRITIPDDSSIHVERDDTSVEHDLSKNGPANGATPTADSTGCRPIGCALACSCGFG